MLFRSQAEAASSGAVDDAIRVVVEGIRGLSGVDVPVGAAGFTVENTSMLLMQQAVLCGQSSNVAAVCTEK